MAEPSVHQGDHYFSGEVSFRTVNFPAGSLTNAGVASAAAIAAGKLEHQYRATFGQSGAAANATQVIYECRGATGTIKSFRAGAIVKAVGDSTVSVDLKKNGTTVLSAPISLASTDTNRVSKAGTLSVTTLVQGDVLEVVVTTAVGTGTLPSGLFAPLTVNEDAVP